MGGSLHYSCVPSVRLRCCRAQTKVSRCNDCCRVFLRMVWLPRVYSPNPMMISAQFVCNYPITFLAFCAAVVIVHIAIVWPAPIAWQSSVLYYFFLRIKRTEHFFSFVPHALRVFAPCSSAAVSIPLNWFRLLIYRFAHTHTHNHKLRIGFSVFRSFF